ncbi:hypothetical protein [Deinococcus sp.]|uniref:hypothetical protein n=1 Tax=Deinococcus sp. TaxID=47478 RepID=UPI003C7D2C3A
MSHDEEVTRLEKEAARDQAMTDKLNEVCEKLDGQDPETAELTRNSARRTFERAYLDELASGYEPLIHK